MKVTAWILVCTIYVFFSGLLPFAGEADYAEHYATEGEHYPDFSYNQTPEVEKPRGGELVYVQPLGSVVSTPLCVLRPLNCAARDRPPPLFLSAIPSLRAPPPLIPA